MIMSDAVRQKAGIVYNVVETVILGMSVALVAWTANKVITLDHDMAAVEMRLRQLENYGSPALQASVADVREIKVNMAALKEGQQRIEKAIEDHLKQVKP